ncbi:uncharacterized protein [Ptychodera flava]|uniref:uncharacterized protein n=1 Tax=Ptychodera flava TaxID=63121 RepID=UPI003969E897
MTTTMPEALSSDFTSGRTSYSAATDSDGMTTTKSIKYVHQSNYSYTLPRKLRQAMQNRFLLPILHSGGGPNFQYRQLKIAIAFAVYTNRTIVLSDFTHHRTRYHIGKVLFEETFNVSVLRQFIPAVSMEDFRDRCGSHIKTAWTFYHWARYVYKPITRYYQESRNWLRERLNVDIPDIESVTFPKSIPESWHAMEETADESCVVMVSPIGFERVHLPNEAVISCAVDGHLVRTSFLQKAVVNVLPNICDGKPMLGFHWRNRTGEDCRVGKPSGTNETTCRELLQMQYRILESIALHILSIMSQEKTGCIFMASAPREPRENVLNQFAAHNLTSIITIDDVINLHNADIDTFGDDDYFISLIEQEICARSKVFVGIGKSNWSTFVFRERRAFQRGKNYDVIKDFPDIIDIADKFS